VESFPLTLSIKDSGKNIIKKYSYVSSRYYNIDPADDAASTDGFGLQEANEGTLSVIFPVFDSANTVDITDDKGVHSLSIPKDILRGKNVAGLAINSINPSGAMYSGQPFSLAWSYAKSPSRASTVSLAVLKNDAVIDYLAVRTSNKTITSTIPYSLELGDGYKLRLEMDSEPFSTIETAPFSITSSDKALQANAFGVKWENVDNAAVGTATFQVHNTSAVSISDIYFHLADSTALSGNIASLYGSVPANSTQTFTIPFSIPSKPGVPITTINLSLFMANALVASDSETTPFTADAITVKNFIIDPLVTGDPLWKKYAPDEIDNLALTATARFDAINSTENFMRNVKFNLSTDFGQLGETTVDIPPHSTKSVTFVLVGPNPDKPETGSSPLELRVGSSDDFNLSMNGLNILTKHVTYTKADVLPGTIEPLKPVNRAPSSEIIQAPSITKGTFNTLQSGLIFDGANLGTTTFAVKISQSGKNLATIQAHGAANKIAVLVPCVFKPGTLYTASVLITSSQTQLYQFNFSIPSTGLPGCPASTPTLSPSASPSSTPSPSASATYSVSPSVTPTYTPSYSPTYSPTYTPTYTPSQTYTSTPSYTPSYTPTQTPTYSPTYTPSNSPSSSPSGSPSNSPVSEAGANHNLMATIFYGIGDLLDALFK
jgi:hypothetical protein